MQLELRNICKNFKSGRTTRFALQDVSMQASGGSIFGLLGPNGAGKTTLVRIALGLSSQSTGQVLIDGEMGANQTASFRKLVGYMPEERGLYRKERVGRTLAYLAELKGVDKRTALQRAAELMERLDLRPCFEQRLDQLSKGTAQKVQIVAALLHQPQLIVLDEPFSGLDPVATKSFRALLEYLAKQGHLIILSTHMMSEVEMLCDRIILLHGGRALLNGRLTDIRSEYSRPIVLFDPEAELDDVKSIERTVVTARGKLAELKAGITVHDLMLELAAGRRHFSRLEVASASLEDIFVRLVAK